MRSIEKIEANQIVDLINEDGLSIDAFALEKDFHVGAALAALSKIKDPTFDLIFCGGTCLSKAYGLLDRLSEDIDIKVVTKPGITLTAGKLRSALSELKQKVVDALIAEGFDKEQFEETILVNERVKKVAIDARDIFGLPRSWCMGLKNRISNPPLLFSISCSRSLAPLTLI
ncbi:MAG: nucleotidyl transferase AbiEii/AbiGii toxin family protein [Burkholderiales bacterium]|nr:nucleotidyl transferase AbiEii/AbiGii toxin family protein [Burkholderiales bacterium]